jgi:hypothetical protein
MLEEAANNSQKINENNEIVTKKHLKSPFSSSNLVTVMMDDHKSQHESDEYSFYLSQQQLHHLNRRDAIAAIAAAENGHHTHKNIDYDEGKSFLLTFIKTHQS